MSRSTAIPHRFDFAMMKMLLLLAALLFPLGAAARPYADAIAVSERKAWLAPASEAFSRDETVAGHKCAPRFRGERTRAMDSNCVAMQIEMRVF